MTLTLHLTAELESRIREQAEATGMAPEDLAIEALTEKLSAEPEASAILPSAEWLAAFDAWIAGHKPRNPNVDDSRESIYADRT